MALMMRQASAAPFTASRIAPRIATSTRSATISSRPSVLRLVCQAAAVEAPPAQQESATRATASSPAKLHPSPLSQAPPKTYAVVEVGGHQLFVEPGKWYTVNRLKAPVGSSIKFGRVLAFKQDGKLAVGQPYLENISVEADVIEELRGPKVIVYKMRPKKHYRRKQGHRQDLSKFLVTQISTA